MKSEDNREEGRDPRKKKHAFDPRKKRNHGDLGEF